MADVPVPILYRRAQTAWSQRDYRTAGKLCDEILARKRNDFNALMLRANVARANGASTEEIEYVSAAVRVQPKNARLRAHLG